MSTNNVLQCVDIPKAVGKVITFLSSGLTTEQVFFFFYIMIDISFGLLSDVKLFYGFC